jgi:acyl phosphate:glycerol-3-phosphate acyltransferase
MEPMDTWLGVLWVLGGYLAGTFPSTYLVARARHGAVVIAASKRDASETDAHLLITEHLGGAWSALAAALDVGKGLAYLLVAQRFGEVPPLWLALIGVAIVVGHCWPPYARAMAGRGLSAASGVLLALLPVEMVIAGLVIVLGMVFRVTGPASTLALASVPVVASIRGQPVAYAAMGAGILAVIVLRRLEGVGGLVARGIPRGRALYYRAIWDVSSPPRGLHRAEGEARSPS